MMDKNAEIHPDFQQDVQKILLEWEMDEAEFRADYAARVEQNANEVLMEMVSFLRSREIEKRATALRWFAGLEDFLFKYVRFARHEPDIQCCLRAIGITGEIPENFTLADLDFGGDAKHFTDSCMCGEH